MTIMADSGSSTVRRGSKGELLRSMNKAVEKGELLRQMPTRSDAKAVYLERSDVEAVQNGGVVDMSIQTDHEDQLKQGRYLYGTVDTSKIAGSNVTGTQHEHLFLNENGTAAGAGGNLDPEGKDNPFQKYDGKDKSTNTDCPKKHGLKLFVSPVGKPCAVCGVQMPNGDRAWRCFSCDFHICIPCHEN